LIGFAGIASLVIGDSAAALTTAREKWLLYEYWVPLANKDPCG